MRKKIVAGNWKMNLSQHEALALQNELNSLSLTSCKVVLFSPSIYLSDLLKNETKIEIGAQNAFPKDSGAFTGEISFKQLRDLGVKNTLIGHSERRNLFNETNDFLKQKVDAALAQNINVFFCVGEQQEEREKGIHNNVITAQLKESLFHLNKTAFEKIVIAYEPVWAIGTGLTASKEQANEMHAHIRNVIADQYDSQTAEMTSILYGGSCKPSNAKELFEQPHIDGGLIGGASLKASDFTSIIQSI